jgi:hypothetical protein
LEVLNFLDEKFYISTPCCVNANVKIKKPKENAAFIHGN